MIDEGYIKFQLDWTRCDLPDLPQIGALNVWRRRLHSAGLIGYDRDLDVGFGNLSCRIAATRFLISGSQTGRLAELDRRHFALVTDVDIVANRVSCRGNLPASSESMTHAALYAVDSSIASVVHVHSADLWSRLKHELPTAAAEVAYGTPEMAREFARLYEQTEFHSAGVAVMAGHQSGLISVGASIEEAATRILSIAHA